MCPSDKSFFCATAGSQGHSRVLWQRIRRWKRGWKRLRWNGNVGPSLFLAQHPQGRAGLRSDIMRCGMSTQRLQLFLPPTSNQNDLFVALPVVFVEALERLERRPSAPLPRNMRRNQKRRSLGIDGGHLGRRISRLAHSFAEVPVLVRQLRWPADEKAERGRNLSGASLQQIINYTDTFPSLRNCKCQTMCCGGGEGKKKDGVAWEVGELNNSSITLCVARQSRQLLFK